MDEVGAFGEIELAVAAAFLVALLSTKLTERVSVPAPAIFLVAAAFAATVSDRVHGYLSVTSVERIAVVALVVILFEGGMHIGRRRLVESLYPIVALGTLGTFATAGLVAVFVHYAFGFDWVIAGVLGAALAPTDPAVTFSVLGNREIGGRSGTILEGESGANDPVGIALMLGMLDLAAHPGGSFTIVLREFGIEMAVGLGIGLAGGFVLIPLMRRISLPSESLYPLRALAAAGVVYGVASVLHGSGFLAVFVAGIVVGDARAPFKAEIERFHGALASLAEIVVFVALGLTIDLSELSARGVWLAGLAIAAVLAFVARPVVVAALLARTRLRWAERAFVTWGGLKGAVPILLAAFALLEHVDQAQRVYGIVFVVVLFSVAVQGTLVPPAASLLGIPMSERPLRPWSISVPLEHEPTGIRRFFVTPGSAADGTTVGDLALDETSWITLVVHEGAAVQPRGDYVLGAGDEVFVLGEDELVGRLFEQTA